MFLANAGGLRPDAGGANEEKQVVPGELAGD